MSRIRTALLAGTAVLCALVTAPANAASAPRVIELEAPVPSWYTPELNAEVEANSLRGVVTPIPAGGHRDIPASGLAFTGIRPGSWILSPGGCTANFVFQTSGNLFNAAQQLYIGTAGHCGNVGQTVTIVAVCPGTSVGGLINVGTITKSVSGPDDQIREDFALIQIRTQWNFCVSPTMAHWGGPTGTYTSNALTGVVHSGHGLVIGTGGTARAGVLTSSNSTHRYWLGATIFGDSGSALNTASGLAIANITHLVIVGPGPSDSAGTRIERILQIAGKPLATCASRVPWPLAGCPTV